MRTLSARVAHRRRLVLGSQADIERSKHGDVDAESRQHELDSAKHKGGERGASKVAQKIDGVDLDWTLLANVPDV